MTDPSWLRPEVLVPPIAVLFVALVGGVLYLLHRIEVKRREALRSVAVRMGFRFSEQGDLPAPVALPIFERGHGRKVHNSLAGETAGRPVVVTDYRYRTGGGKNQQTHLHTIVVFPQGAQGLPDFELGPENVLHRIGQLFGYQDLDFDDDEEFSKRYLLRGEDEMAIRRTFNRAARAFLVQNEGRNVQVRGGTAGLFRGRTRVAPVEIPSYLADALRILSGLTPSQT